MPDIKKWTVPLLIIETAGHIDGKTRIQKLVYLAQNQKEETIFHYRNYLHGPFSIELSQTIDELKCSGFINEFISITPSGYQLHIYEITEEGKSMLSFLRRINRSFIEWRSISNEIIDTYGKLKLDALLKIVYEYADLPWPPKENHQE